MTYNNLKKQNTTTDMEENFIMILPEEIKKVGIHKALILAYIRGWLATNANNPIANRDGRIWSFQTLDTWCENTGVRRGTIRNHLQELREKGIVLAGNYNRLGFDRTIWYSLADNYKELVLEYAPANSNNSSDIIDQQDNTNSTDSMEISRQLEIPFESSATVTEETTIQYTNEEINETINEVTRSTDQSTDQSNEFIKLYLGVRDFLDTINLSMDSDEKLDYAKLLQKIIDNYGYDDGIFLIYDFIYNNQTADDIVTHIFLDEIKAKRNRFLN